jgi:hypothetical protein
MPMAALTIWADRKGLRELFPTPVRRPLHSLKKGLFRHPVRFLFDRSRAGPCPVCLIVVGTPFADWLPALTSPDTWQGLPSVAEVVLLLAPATPASLVPPATSGCRVIVVPLREETIRLFPTSIGLFPDARAVETLGNKRRFAEYVRDSGLAQWCPADYRTTEDIRLPCIVKPVDYGRPKVARTREELRALFVGDSWSPARFVVQEYIPGQVEYTLHAILKDGRLLWSCSFAFEKDGDARFGVEFRTMQPFDPPPAVFEALESILRPLRYSGPCNVDYTIRDSGVPAIFEINPRFGGSLFLAANSHHLRQALRCLVLEAKGQSFPG